MHKSCVTFWDSSVFSNCFYSLLSLEGGSGVSVAAQYCWGLGGSLAGKDQVDTGAVLENGKHWSGFVFLYIWEEDKLHFVIPQGGDKSPSWTTSLLGETQSSTGAAAQVLCLMSQPESLSCSSHLQLSRTPSGDYLPEEGCFRAVVVVIYQVVICPKNFTFCIRAMGTSTKGFGSSFSRKVRAGQSR